MIQTFYYRLFLVCRKSYKYFVLALFQDVFFLYSLIDYLYQENSEHAAPQSRANSSIRASQARIKACAAVEARKWLRPQLLSASGLLRPFPLLCQILPLISLFNWVYNCGFEVEEKTRSGYGGKEERIREKVEEEEDKSTSTCWNAGLKPASPHQFVQFVPGSNCSVFLPQSSFLSFYKFFINKILFM